MDTQLPDPTDWASTPLSPLGAVDSLLRCQICKDFYTSAVLTTCAHTFCSLCIRRSLSADGRCPSCRTPEQESRLRRNGAVQEVVDSFVAQRDTLLETARNFVAPNAGASPSDGIPEKASSRSKRKRAPELSGEEPPARRTRSQRATTSQTASDTRARKSADLVVLDTDDDEDYTPCSTAKSPGATPPEPDDGLVACPSCSKRMKEEAVFTHLDNCTGKDGAAPVQQSASRSKSNTISNKPVAAPPAPQRLPQLSYSLLKDNALRKKLEEFKIPAWGPRALLIRRHSEWLALWNANCDSNNPKARTALLKELDAWEKSQGGRSSNGGGTGEGIKAKEFESEEWARRNKGEFTDLIAKARAQRKSEAASKPNMDETPDTTTSAHAPEPNDASDITPLQDPDLLLSPYRREATAPPSTGPLKVSQSLHDDHVPAVAPPDPPAAGMPALRPQRTAPAPDTLSPESKRRRKDAHMNPRIAIPPAAGSATDSLASSAARTRRPSLSQATPTDPTPPALLMWSSSTDGQAGSGDGVRKMPMFQVSADPVVDTDLPGGSGT